MKITLAEIRVIIVCVNYADYLVRTIDRTRDIFENVLIITDTKDEVTTKIIEEYFCAGLRTDAFYANGADFNKGVAIESGFEFLAHYGWFLILDADILLPKDFSLPEELDEHCLYGMKRKENGGVLPDKELAGYFQLFHGMCKHLRSLPWYGTKWRHAGGCDSEFQAKYPKESRIWLPGYVDHLGKRGIDWCGRTPEAKNKLKDYLMLRRRNRNYKAEQL